MILGDPDLNTCCILNEFNIRIQRYKHAAL
jgi:hypothetical protein